MKQNWNFEEKKLNFEEKNEFLKKKNWIFEEKNLTLKNRILFSPRVPMSFLKNVHLVQPLAQLLIADIYILNKILSPQTFHYNPFFKLYLVETVSSHYIICLSVYLFVLVFACIQWTSKRLNRSDPNFVWDLTWSSGKFYWWSKFQN